jgi:AraC-like DNA-binding protein
MHHPPDILTIAHLRPFMHEDLQLIVEKERRMPGAIRYSINRYLRLPQWSIEDAGMINYHFRKDAPAENYFELKFCLSGNVYCSRNEYECESCKLHTGRTCTEKTETLDILSFRFEPMHLAQFASTGRQSDDLSEKILQFLHPSSFSKILPLCGRIRLVLESLLNHRHSGSLENIFINAQMHMLLVYALECMIGEQDVEGFRCKFLANEEDREKIARAREILLEHIGEPLTIKELSRKAAINECYLKKGFKEMFGTTIFDFYQGQRMEHARYLLYEKGLSVTDVSVLLGYSSISHFSTAFKKHTGLKPCELLFH